VVPASGGYSRQTLPETLLALPETEDWPAFVDETLPELDKKGWRVTIASSFRHHVIEIDAIEGTARQAGDGWFDLEMGITLGDRTVRLEPLLAGLFRRDRRWLGGALETIDDDEAIELTTDRAERLRLRAGRLKPVVRVLVDLFDGIGSWKGDD
jgi:hypothetical protein